MEDDDFVMDGHLFSASPCPSQEEELEEGEIGEKEEEEEEETVLAKSFKRKSDNRLIIKFKNPNGDKVKFKNPNGDKSNGGGGGGGDQVKRVCEVCNKSFSSGKALGGHMRVHSLSLGGRGGKDEEDVDDLDIKPKLKQLKPKSQTTSQCHNKKMVKMMEIPISAPTTTITEANNKNLDNSDLVPPSCVICGKGFPSKKSLFGHMRCHPDRLWRGIIPPPATTPKNITTTTTSSSSMKEDPSGSGRRSSSPLLQSWSVKAKRGRDRATTHSASASPPPPPCAFGEREAAYCLLLLAAGEIEMRKQRSNGIGRSTFDRESDNVMQDDYGWSSYSDDEGLAAIRKRRKIKQRDIEDRVGEVMEYRCSTCNRCFPTHQALGGHRSSHNKFNEAAAALAVKEEEEEEEVEQSEELVNSGDHLMGNGVIDTSAASKQQSSYICKICNKSFPSGQALGGHKRCHWNAPLPVLEAPPALIPTTSTTITSSVASREEEAASEKVLDFDLNELPVMEDEDEEEEEEAIDHASSSHNSAT